MKLNELTAAIIPTLHARLNSLSAQDVAFFSPSSVGLFLESDPPCRWIIPSLFPTQDDAEGRIAQAGALGEPINFFSHKVKE